MSDLVIVMDDVQMECVRGPQKEQCIFLTAQQNSRNQLRFIATRVIYNAAIEDNVTLGTETFDASEFSAWWIKRRKNGWRFCE